MMTRFRDMAYELNLCENHRARVETFHVNSRRQAAWGRHISKVSS